MKALDQLLVTGEGDRDLAAPRSIEPGKQTLTRHLPPVQRLASTSSPQPARTPAAASFAGAVDDPFGLHLLATAAPRDAGATIWRKSTGRDDVASADGAFARATAGGASEIPYRAEMERSFGQDFGGVQAFLGRTDAVGELRAEAAARGEQVAFASASPGRELVAHELAHVVQARHHGGGPVQGKGVVSTSGDAAEREADDVAARVVRGEQVTVGAAPTAAISRYEGQVAHESGGTGNANFTTPIAQATDGEFITITIPFHTQNKFDRASWSYQLQSNGRVKTGGDRVWWNNPAWDAPVWAPDANFAADGDGTANVKRTITARVPVEEFTRFFEEDGGASETSTITFGMKLWYNKRGPTVASKEEEATAYGAGSGEHNWGYTRGDVEGGRADLAKVKEALGLKKGNWLTDKQVWQQPLPDNPSPNKLKELPTDFAKTHKSFRPLAPQKALMNKKQKKDVEFPFMLEAGALRLATRIENEATLKVSSPKALADLVETLRRSGDVIDGVMKRGGAPLDAYTWSLEPEGHPLVFTDVYMDDPAFTALKSGVGIRKRMSDTATKLNVKTGRGYQVGKLDEGGQETEEKSDIYRRHEIGFDIDPEATGKQIGAYLHDGVDGKDAWNKGGEQANLTAKKETGKAIDFTKLAERMVLQGHRTKFKLQARPEAGPPINIEISCDHTVGRTFAAFKDSKEPEDLFRDLEGKYKHIYNVELELEHLGAGAPQPESVPVEDSHDESHEESDELGGKLEDSSDGVKAPEFIPPPNHPGRMYMLGDTSSKQFNTPSFTVFARAHDQLIAWMRSTMDGGDGELGEAPQKLEALYGELKGAL